MYLENKSVEWIKLLQDLGLFAANSEHDHEFVISLGRREIPG
jgi:hypothetical protein